MVRSGSWVSGQTWNGERDKKSIHAVTVTWLALLGCQREICGAWSPSLVAFCHPHSAWSDAHLQAEAGQHLIGGQDIVHGTTLLPATKCGSPRGKSPSRITQGDLLSGDPLPAHCL